MSTEQKALWAQVAIKPTKWEEKEHGVKGHGFWVIGIYRNRAIWYNDIEEGFNISSFEHYGSLNSYEAEQDELQWTIQKLKNESI